jgi:hypothetical protein
MEHEAGRPAAGKDPEGGGRHRHPHARRARGVRRHAARPQDRNPDLRGDLGRDLARRLRPFRQDGADLEGVGAAAERRAAPPPGALVPAPRQGPDLSPRALPDRAERRLRPLAPLQRAGSGDAHARSPEGRPLGDQRPQAVHQQRL